MHKRKEIHIKLLFLLHSNWDLIPFSIRNTTRLIYWTCLIPATVRYGTVSNNSTLVWLGEKRTKRRESSHMEVSGGIGPSCSSSSRDIHSAVQWSTAVLYSLLLSRSKQNTKEYCVFYMSNALTCSGKVHVKRIDSDSTRFMALAEEIMLFFPLKAL